MAEHTEHIGPYDVDTTEENQLGSGTFGTVFKAVQRETGEYVAAKLLAPLNNKPVWIHTFEVLAKREVDILERIRELPHINILKILHIEDNREAAKFDDKKVWIMSELCDLGDLNSYFAVFDVKLSHIIDITHQSCCGLLHLHSMTPMVIHRNIKPSNLLLTSAHGRHVVKLCDLGIAREIDGQPLTEGGHVGTKTQKTICIFLEYEL